jgi:hypothetical protein
MERGTITVKDGMVVVIVAHRRGAEQILVTGEEALSDVLRELRREVGRPRVSCRFLTPQADIQLRLLRASELPTAEGFTALVWT